MSQRRAYYLKPVDILLKDIQKQERGEIRYALGLTLKFLGALCAGGSVLLLLHTFGR